MEFGRLAEATEVGTGTVERLELAADELAIAYPSTPSAELYGRARDYLRYVGGLLDARMTLAEHRRLLVGRVLARLPGSPGVLVGQPTGTRAGIGFR